jgi:hypothetical protein
VSVIVQALLSLHAVSFGFAGLEHVPFAGLHVPALWHWSLAVHVTGAPGWQLPDWHLSACVQASPSVHAVLSGFAGLEHIPFVGLHVPTLWH